MRFISGWRLAVWPAVVLALAACGGGSDAPKRQPVGHVYTQTNESSNKIIHYGRLADGTLREVERVASGGQGTNGFKPATGEASAPDSLFSAGSVAMSADHRLLFAVNAGDSSVSSFAVAENGALTLLDRQPTGERAPPSSVTYNNATQTLFVLHTTGPDHIRSFKVANGKLANTGAAYTVNTAQVDGRVATQIISSPDDRFVLVDVVFDAPPQPGANGPVLTPSNAQAGNGLMVFPVQPDGSLGQVVVNDAGGPTPFSLAFLRGSSTRFVNTFAAANGAVLSTLGADGRVRNTPLSDVDLSPAPNGPAETCWVSLSPDNRYAYGTNFGFGNITSFELTDSSIRVAADNQGAVAGDGLFKSLAGIPTSGANDSWASADGYLYQLYPNARELAAYRMNGPLLEKVGSSAVPYNSTSGLVGF